MTKRILQGVVSCKSCKSIQSGLKEIYIERICTRSIWYLLGSHLAYYIAVSHCSVENGPIWALPEWPSTTHHNCVTPPLTPGSCDALVAPPKGSGESNPSHAPGDG